MYRHIVVREQLIRITSRVENPASCLPAPNASLRKQGMGADLSIFMFVMGGVCYSNQKIFSADRQALW